MRPVPGADQDELAAEAALVERAKLDPAAFGELYERYVPRIYRFVYNRLHDRDLAEDVTSDVFLKALRGLDRYRSQGRPFGVWLHQIALNTVIDHVRTHHPTLDLEAVGERAASQTAVDELAVQRADLREVRAALATLNEAQRTAVSLRLGQDLDTAEIAAVMGKSEGAVRILIHRGLSAVRQRLAETSECPH